MPSSPVQSSSSGWDSLWDELQIQQQSRIGRLGSASMICNEIAARLETQCRKYLYKKLGICDFLHPQKQISCENHNPTHKGRRRTPENKLTGEASKKNSKTKRPYQAWGATLMRTFLCHGKKNKTCKTTKSGLLCVCVCVLASEKTRHTAKKKSKFHSTKTRPKRNLNARKLFKEAN